MTKNKVRIPARYAPLVGGFFMSACMSLGMSIGITLIRNDVDAEIVRHWLDNLIIGFGVNLPLTLLLSPRVRRLVDAITE